jgi:hypothetical protein
MSLGATLSEGSSGEQISHFAALKIRANGNGSLTMIVYSLDDIKIKVLVPFVLADKSRIIPTRLVNFMEQRASFEFRLDLPGAKFRINRIVIFAKEVFTSYPGS